MNRINELRDITINLLSSTLEFAARYKLPEKEKKLKLFIDRLNRGRTVVVVCGEYKRGKSSFVNAFVEDNNLCPVDIDITTNMVTQIQYSEKEYYKIHFNKESGKKPALISREEIPEYVTEVRNKDNRQMVQVLDVGIHNDKLNNGLMMLVDTPGVGSLNIKHSEVTAMYLNYADVVLFVSDVNAPLTIPEIEFIKRASKYSPNIYFILSKIDKMSGWKVIEEENRKKISEALSKPPENVKIFPVSSLNKIDYIKTGDEESLEDSKFSEMEEALMKELSSSIAKNILLFPLFTAKNDMSNIKNSLTLQYDTFKQESSERKKEIDKKLEEINERYKTVQKSSSRWQMLFNDSSVEIKGKMRRKLNQGFANLEEEVKIEIANRSFRDNPDVINAFIRNHIIDIMKDVNDLLDGEVAEMQEKIYELIGEEIDIEIGEFNIGSIIEVDINKVKDNRSKLEKTRDMGRSISINTSAFTVMGGLVGGVLGGVFGFLGTAGLGVVPAAQGGAVIGSSFGATLGAFFGVSNNSKEINKRLQADATRTCLETIRENKVNCFDVMDTEFSRIISEIRSSIVFSIQESMETIEKTRSEISKNMNLKATEAAEKSKKLQEDIKQITTLENQIKNTVIEVQKL